MMDGQFKIKRIFLSLCFIFISTLPVLADIMAVQAITVISTERPDEIFKVRVLRDCTLADIPLKNGYILEGKILCVTEPKRLKKNAVFTFFPINYINSDGDCTHIPKLYIGTYKPKFNLDKGDLALGAALNAGNKLIFQGISTGFYAVQGAVQNKEGNFVVSAVNNVYEHSIFSYIEKGTHIEILPDSCFGLEFPECVNTEKNRKYFSSCKKSGN